MQTYWPNLSYFFLSPFFLLASIALTVINSFSAVFIILRVGQINPGTFGAALTTQCSGLSEALLPLSASILDSSSASQSSSQLSRLSKSPFQLSQFLLLEMLSGTISSLLSAGWQLILLIRQTFNTGVCPPGRSFAHKAGGKDDLSDNVNAATPSCWKLDQDAPMISSLFQIYSTAVICAFWAWDSFFVACRLWLPCLIFKTLWTLATPCNYLFSSSFVNSKSFSVSMVSNAAQSPTNIPSLPGANCLNLTFARRVLPVVSDCLLPITSRPREKLASTPTQCSIIENMSHGTSEGLAYFVCISSCWRQQLVISGNQNVLLIFKGSEWESLKFGFICPQFFGVLGCGFRWSLAAINYSAAWLLRPDDDSVMVLGDKFSSSLPEKLYGTKHE